jgi:lysylphosphatidylglycerol synthetase-like protein (DUF2156 family)
MNLLILTKISKFMLIGSATAYLSFASQNNPLLRQAFFYLLGGLIAVIVIALLWEGRDSVASEPTEESVNALLSLTSHNKAKKQYLLSTSTRLEIVIGLVVIVVSLFIGMI